MPTYQCYAIGTPTGCYQLFTDPKNKFKMKTIIIKSKHDFADFEAAEAISITIEVVRGHDEEPVIE